MIEEHGVVCRRPGSWSSCMGVHYWTDASTREFCPTCDSRDLPLARARAPWWRRLLAWLRPHPIAWEVGSWSRALADGGIPLALPAPRRPYTAPAVTSFDAAPGGHRDQQGGIDYDLGNGKRWRRPPPPTSMPSNGTPYLG